MFEADSQPDKNRSAIARGGAGHTVWLVTGRTDYLLVHCYPGEGNDPLNPGRLAGLALGLRAGIPAFLLAGGLMLGG